MTSAYNPQTGQFSENDPTKPLGNADLQQFLADQRAAALPAGAGKLLAATGSAGTAAPIVLGSGLGLNNGVLTSTVSVNAGVATVSAAGLVKPDGSTTAVDSNGSLSVVGSALKDLTAVSVLDSTKLLPVGDTTSGALNKGTFAQLLAWILANDGSVDLLQSTLLSSIPNGLVVFGALPDGTPVRVPASLVGTSGGSGSTGSAPVNSAPPVISGSAQVGQTLSASQGTWTNSPTSYAYQWKRAGTAISGATNSTYTPVSADVGNALTVTVTATNAGGSASATSAATSAVIAAGATATTYTISTPPTGTAGTAQTVTVATTGSLSSSVVVTLSDGASGTFGGTVTLAAGNNSSGTTQYTPASAGTRTVSGTNNGGLTNPTGQTVTVAASAGRPALTLTSPVFASTGDTPGPLYGAKSFKGGSGVATIPVPANGNGGNLASVGIRGSIRLVPGTRSLTGVVARITSAAGLVLELRVGTGGDICGSTAGSGTVSSGAPVNDGNKHTFNLFVVSNYGSYNYSSIYADTMGTQNNITQGASGVFEASNASFQIVWQNMLAGDMIDNIEITTTDAGTGTSQTVAITPTSSTLALYNFDNGDGLSS